MDFLIFVILSAICSTAANQLAEKTIAQAIVSSAAGGAIEEVVEYLVKKITPNGHFYFLRNRKPNKLLYTAVNDFFQGLSPADQETLIEFMDKLDYRKVSPKYAQLMELVKGDLTKALQKMQNIKEPENKIFRKKTQNLIHDLYDKLEKNVTEDLKEKSLNDIVADLFDTKWDAMPEVAKKLFKEINDKVYELKYFKMSTEDRDLVKVIQYMIKEGNEALLTKLQPSFQYIGQISNCADAAYKTINIEEMAKINPFCYFRLECPNCKATGASVRKDSDNNVYCTSCGQTHSIVRAVRDDEVAELIGKKFEEAQKQLASVIENKTGKIEKALDHLAGKILDTTYFETYFKEFKTSLTAQGDNREARIIDTLAQIVNDSEDRITQKVAAEVAKIKSNDSDALLQKLEERIEEYNEQNRKLLFEIYDIVEQTREDVMHMKMMISMMLPLTINIATDISELKDMMKVLMRSVAAKRIPSKKLTCPFCGYLTEFENQDDTSYYHCSICDCQIDTASFIPNAIPSCTAPEFEFRQRGNTGLMVCRAGSSEISPNVDVVLIHLDCDSVNMLNDQYITIYQRDGNSIHPAKIILRGNVSINESNLRQIFNLFRTAQVIVLGKDITLISNGDPTLRIDYPARPVWRYEEERHRLMQTQN